MKISVRKESAGPVAFFLIAGAVFWLLSKKAPAFFWFSGLSGLLAVFSLYFFRDPERKYPEITARGIENFLLSPGDGRVLEVSRENETTVLRIFLSLFDVHLQRAPLEGKVITTMYHPGKFLIAKNEQAHKVNERNEIIFETKYGQYSVVQIAGIIARRIRCWLEPDEMVVKGERIGLIQFGSQVDLKLFFPGVEILVKKGDRVRAGESIIGIIRK
jgi:phosphatidylserine decarboxylase